MRVLVAYGSELGGTAGIAELIGSAVEEAPPVPRWRWSCCRLTSWTGCMPNRLTKLWNGRRPPKGELWP